MFKKGHKSVGGRPPKAIKKVPLSVYVLPTTKEYLKASQVKGGDVLDEYVMMEKTLADLKEGKI